MIHIWKVIYQKGHFAFEEVIFFATTSKNVTLVAEAWEQSIYNQIDNCLCRVEYIGEIANSKELS